MSGKRIAAATLALLVAVALGLSACAEPIGYAAPGYVDYGYPDGWVDGWGYRRHWDHGGWGHGFAHGHSGFGHGGFAGHHGGFGGHGGGGHGR